MKINVLKRMTAFLAKAMLLGFAPLSSVQDKPANNMEIVHEKLKADKKSIVTKYSVFQFSVIYYKLDCFFPFDIAQGFSQRPKRRHCERSEAISHH